MTDSIQFDNVGFEYKDTSFRISEISILLDRWHTTIIRGNNGSGKTTLAKLMMGILKPDTGQINICGQDAKNMRISERAKHIGFCLQNPDKQFFCSTALEEVAFSVKHWDQSNSDVNERALALLARLSLQDKADEFPLKLSAGEKKRLALLSILALKRPYYIVDEPATSIDGENKKKMLDLLLEAKRSGAGLCIITHDRAIIESLADRVITMANGRVVQDEKT